ncbi:hypothetical protein [Plantactinospora sonchi]|uniref:Uncharacterized protein n=1 Tax=Plantactinospora sonchi TaxID=1544735 RepID=A0ABU7RRV0_9ACTN
MRRVAGCSAAAAMAPYFVIKIFWTLHGLRGGGLHDGAWSRLDWAAINGLTVGMSGLAILLGLALGQRWGMRVPGWLMLLPAWIGAGFLVPVIPVLPILLVLSPVGDAGGGGTDPAMPGWEAGLLTVSFAGFGLGVAIAVPIYAGQRWPGALTGRPTDDSVGTAFRSVRDVTARFAAAICVVLGLPQIFWGLGGTLGLQPATLDARDPQWHVLTVNTGLWALIGAWGVWSLTRRRADFRGRTAMLLTWTASGFLFAWGTWKAAFTFAVVPSFPPPEYLWVLALQNHVGALAGVMILLVGLLTVADRRQARTADPERTV